MSAARRRRAVAALDKLREDEDMAEDTTKRTRMAMDDAAAADSDDSASDHASFSDGDEDDEDNEFLAASDSDEDEELSEEDSSDDDAALSSDDDSDDADQDEGKKGSGAAAAGGAADKPISIDFAPNEADNSDSSDDEGLAKNPVGNIPMEWYDEYEHIGYDREGKPIRRKHKKRDEIEDLLEKQDNPNYWRTLYDEVTGEEVVLTDKELDTILRVQRGMYPDSEVDPHPAWPEKLYHYDSLHPVSNAPEPKRRFVPSKWEHKLVMKIVRGLREGRIKPLGEKPPPKPDAYMLWDDDSLTGTINTKVYGAMALPAPKLKLPGHFESYNPPPEYLPLDGAGVFRYKSMREIPAFKHFIRERFERCLDLYLAPRSRKNKLNIDPKSLIPQLPKPEELRPFPTTERIRYTGLTDMVRSVSVDPTGQWLAAGGDDGVLQVWEVNTGRPVFRRIMGGVVHCVVWNPRATTPCIAVAVAHTVHLLAPRVTCSAAQWTDMHALATKCEAGARAHEAALAADSLAKHGPVCAWSVHAADDTAPRKQQVLEIAVSMARHTHAVKDVAWHAKGDYFTSVCPGAGSQAVAVSQLSKGKTQNPFRALRGQVQCTMFHPAQPLLFVATQRHIRVYNLVRQELHKKLLPGVKWISCMAMHPGGDNLIMGSYDKRVCWFDLDLSTKPYKTLRYHRFAVRSVRFSPRFPLFASASDDGKVHIFHGRVFNSYTENALIVPLKILRGHTRTNELGVLSCSWHPTQPWIFSSGADGTVRLFC